MNTQFVIICLTNRNEDQGKGTYELATPRVFNTRPGAEKYLSRINPAREPVIVSGHFGQLRFMAKVQEHPHLLM